MIEFRLSANLNNKKLRYVALLKFLMKITRKIVQLFAENKYICLITIT